MKKYFSLLFIALFALSCEGPVGPQGPPGPEGLPGPIANAFRVTANFTFNGNYQEIFGLPEDIFVLESDIVMVYLRWSESEVGYVWQPLPVTIYFSDGEFQYAFDHTKVDVRLFLDGNIDLSTLGAEWTDNQVFKVVILPADYVNANNVNLKDVEAVMRLVDKSEVKSYNIKELQ